MIALLNRTAEEDGEKSALMIYYHLWKEKGNKLPTDLLFLDTIEARERDHSWNGAVYNAYLFVDHSLIDCLQLNYWEREKKNLCDIGKVIQHRVICIRVWGQATNKHWTLIWLYNSNLIDPGHTNSSISMNAATKYIVGREPGMDPWVQVVTSHLGATLHRSFFTDFFFLIMLSLSHPWKTYASDTMFCNFYIHWLVEFSPQTYLRKWASEKCVGVAGEQSAWLSLLDECPH